MLATLKPTTDEFLTDLNAMLEKTNTTDLTTWVVESDFDYLSFTKYRDETSDYNVHVNIFLDVIEVTSNHLTGDGEVEVIQSIDHNFDKVSKVSNHFSATFSVAWFLNLADNYPQG